MARVAVSTTDMSGEEGRKEDRERWMSQLRSDLSEVSKRRSFGTDKIGALLETYDKNHDGFFSTNEYDYLVFARSIYLARALFSNHFMSCA